MGVNLMIGIHNHQPVGNFPWVFEEAHDRSYGPFLKTLRKYPEIKITLHNSGPLIDWMTANRPEYLDTVAELVSRGQIEVMGGGYYEPIISIIPEADALSQIRQMSGWVAGRFGRPPQGIWMTERVWEPELARITARAGIRYTLLDDTHFRYAGLSDDTLFGYYLTEHSGSVLAVFPIDRGLRYAIPFRETHETIARLAEIAEKRPGAGVVYGDDGEKFGLWPGTHEWVFEQGWLARFFEAILENKNWITLLTFSEYLDRFPPAGRVYLPTASYEEMTEWSLPAEAIGRYREVKRKIADAGLFDAAQPFVRGGFFSNFLAKYVESNNMHKRMLYVSGKVNAAPPERRERALPFLLASQCNCAYWHGLFGGLYLNYLRHAVWENLSKALRIVAEGSPPACERLDFDADGHDELLVTTPSLSAGIAPAVGGSLFFLDLVKWSFCLSNTMSRVFEAYHVDAKKASQQDAENGHPESIHDHMTLKDEGVLDILVYDRHPRYSFMDHVFKEPPSVDDMVMSRWHEAADFIDGGYEIGEVVCSGDGVSVTLSREGIVENGSKRVPIGMKKVYDIGGEGSRIRVAYELVNRGEQDVGFWFGVEQNFTLLGGSDPQRYLLFGDGDRVQMGGRGEHEGEVKLSVVNEYDGFVAAFDPIPCSRLIYFGVQTASNSEGGLERTYQGTCIIPIVRVELTAGGSARLDIAMTFCAIG